MAQSVPGDLDRIKDEGLNHSQVMAHLSYLTDVIGGRSAFVYQSAMMDDRMPRKPFNLQVK